MKKLTEKEIKKFAAFLGFTKNEAKDITNLFYTLKSDNLNSKVKLPLDNVEEYIREYENCWHRENNIQECFEYERDFCSDCYSDEEIQSGIFDNLEKFKEFSMGNGNNQFVYQLPNNEMVVVCS